MEKDKRIIAYEIVDFLVAGYKEALVTFTDKKRFENMMVECSDAILAMQNNCKRPVSFITAGLLMLLPDDEPMDVDEKKEYEMMVKAAIVWYVLQEIPDIAKEFKVVIEK